MGRISGRAAGRPRRLSMRKLKPPSPAASAMRSGAGDGLPAVAVNRHKQAKTGRFSAATCKRRKARASRPASRPGQDAGKAAAGQQLLQAPCRLPAGTHDDQPFRNHPGRRPGRRMRQPGRRHQRQPAACRPTIAPSAGSNRLSSPRPPRSTRNSVRLPRGQPPPGNSASSSGWPLGMVASGRLASVSPHQTSPLASTSARAIGNGAALMTRC